MSTNPDISKVGLDHEFQFAYLKVTAHPVRHPERSEGSPDDGTVPIPEIPHCVRDDVTCRQLHLIANRV